VATEAKSTEGWRAGAEGVRPSSARAARQVRVVTWASVLLNIPLFAFKMAAGLFGNSQAIVAEAVHTLSDATTDVAILVGVRYWTAPADEDHPHGHRRIETLVAAFIAAVLAVVATLLIYRAVATLRDRHESPSLVALVAAAVSLVVKEGLYRWTVLVGRRIRSAAVITNAWHHRSDALAAVPAGLAIAGARTGPSWAFLDHVGAVVVSLIIYQAAWSIGWPALRQLMDTGASQEVRRRLTAIALSVEGVRVVHAVRTRHVGPALEADLHIVVDGSMSVQRGHDISEAVKQRLLAEGPDVVDVVVHLEPDQGIEQTGQER